MNRRSIRFRLTAWYAAILAVTFTAVGVGVWLAIRGSINDTVDKDLRSRAQAMRNYLGGRAPGDSSTRDKLFENVALTPAGTRFRIADSTGRWVYQSPGTESWDLAFHDPSRLPTRGRAETATQNGKSLRVLSARIPSGLIQIGMPTDEFDEMLNAFTWTALLASPILLLLASAGGYWMSRHALAPVERIARTANEIEAKNLSERLPLLGTGDELDHLSETLNAMLARLEDSFRRITQFTADASHELRTPVAIIRTTAEVIRKKPRTEKEYAEALDRILAESERTSELIEDLMVLARADANNEDTVHEPIALAELAETSCTDARVLAEAVGVRLANEGFSPCTVLGDYGALRRLILILLDNAVKYSKPSGEIQVGLHLCPKAGRQVAVLEVRDDGIGISPDDLPHVFERFYRASKDRSRRVNGVGLGLSIAQLIACQHGGEIQVESRLGVGSTFRASLPVL
jgi:heavy metal sensor kinase